MFDCYELVVELVGGEVDVVGGDCDVVYSSGKSECCDDDVCIG